MESVLITGGTGTFGRAFVRKALAMSGLKKIIIFSRDEWKQWEMQQELRDPRLRFFLGDVRDLSRLQRAFDGVDAVVHAAALKQVPTAEYNPSEFVQTNVIGAMNVIDAAIECGVKRVAALSTDKAVNPINLYGATKLCADKLFIAAEAYVGARLQPRFAVVRYGNVLGSRGSVLPAWKKMLADGATALPVTHPDMTRFWISIESAVHAVFRALETMEGGEIYVPKAPSMKLVDLAHALGAEVEIVGLRPGEKLHEVLISAEESAALYDRGDHFLLLRKPRASLGSPLPRPFVYASDTNDQWLAPEAVEAHASAALI